MAIITGLHKAPTMKEKVFMSEINKVLKFYTNSYFPDGGF